MENVKTIAELVIEHAIEYASCEIPGTYFGLKCLELEDNPENYDAANKYLAALSIIVKSMNK